MYNFLSELAARTHEENAHWWRDPRTGNRIERSKGQTLFLICSELVEAGEGERKGLMDDHLTHRAMAEVELADALIRLFDYIGAHTYDIDAVLRISHPNLRDKSWPALQDYFIGRFYKRSGNKAEQLMQMISAVNKVFELEEAGSIKPGNVKKAMTANAIAWVIALICDYAAIWGYDLDGAITEKKAYNKTRADHKDAARLAAGGKKW